jgi:EAL domain-containing protein (putative c-di-GMP-specific phosphodiesterase class I)
MVQSDDIEARFRTAGNFTEALKKGSFALFCQPIVPVESGKADYKYLEIFVRFREEEDKLVPPGGFFPILEANHLTPLLDRWVVREVLKWAAEEQGDQPNWHIPRFNLNLADDTIRDKDFGGQVRDQLKASRIPSNRLWFELTSQQMARFPDVAKQTITRLKSLGCAIAVSDFSGTEMVARGYKDAGAQIVKLSGSVVRNIHRSPEALSKLLELNTCCHKLGMQTIAEFVEEPETLPLLRKAGVNFAQGFGIAEPGPLKLVI